MDGCSSHVSGFLEVRLDAGKRRDRVKAGQSLVVDTENRRVFRNGDFTGRSSIQHVCAGNVVGSEDRRRFRKSLELFLQITLGLKVLGLDAVTTKGVDIGPAAASRPSAGFGNR